MSDIKKIAFGSFIVLCGLVIGKIFAYMFRVLLARLGSDAYGLYSLALAITEIFIVASVAGLGFAITRYVAFYHAKNQARKVSATMHTVLRLILPLSLVGAILLIISAPAIAVHIFRNENLIIPLRIFALSIPFFTCKRAITAAMQATLKIKQTVIVNTILFEVVRIIFFLWLINLGFKVNGAVLATLIAAVIIVFAGYYWIRPLLEAKYTPSVKSEIKTELYGFSPPLAGTNLLLIMKFWLGTYMIGYFMDVHSVALYNIALPTAALLTIPVQAIRTIYFPVMTKRYSKGQHLGSVYAFVLLLIFIINGILGLPLILWSKQIITFLFGRAYVGAATTLSILAMFYVFHSFLSFNAPLLTIFKKTKTIFYVMLAGFTINVLLNVLLIPPLGILGAALSIGITMIGEGVIYGILAYTTIKHNYGSVPKY